MQFLFPILALSVASASECPTFVPYGAVTASAEEAIRAFRAWDEDAFATASDTLRRDLGCTQALTADEAAVIHLALALDAVSPWDKVALDAHLRAVLALWPDFILPADMAPPGGPLDLALRSARGPVSHTPVPVAAPCGGALPFDIDGEQASSWSGERAAIAQVFDGSGSTTILFNPGGGTSSVNPAMRTEILLPGAGNPFVGMSCPTKPVVSPAGRALLLTSLGLGLAGGVASGYSAWHSAQADAIAAGEVAGVQHPARTIETHREQAMVGTDAMLLFAFTSIGVGATAMFVF